MTTTFILPVEVVSEANRRDCWQVKSRRVKQQKWLVEKSMKWTPFVSSCRYVITLTRIMAKRQRPFDGDNLQRAFKAVRDGVAKCLGIDDGSDRLEWRYRQEKGERGAVRVEIEQA